jgi:UDP-3-O-[3-hydroxymyristoyl] glucosamine N-acyltransferase
MKFETGHDIEELADFLGARLVGNPHQLITGINEIHKVDPGDITFVDYHKYYQKALESPAAAIIIDVEMVCPEGKSMLISEDPFRDYNLLARRFRPLNITSEITKLKAFHNQGSQEIAEDVIIMPGAYIGRDVRIGKGSIIYPNVVLYDHTEIGEYVTIHANSTIGADAFYYKHRKEFDPPRYEKMHTIGRVVIEDHVEIGSGCTIDRGVSGTTRIGRGTKIDNLVMIGHGVVIGKNCLIAAQAGIAGKTVLEDDVIVWAQVGISKGLRIGKGCIILAQSGVSKDLEGGKVYLGAPAIEARQAWKDIANLRRLREKT